MDRIRQLDGWRGISIALVVIGHIVNYKYEIPNVVAAMLATWGVYIFFVISGFIITKLALRERAETGSFSIRDFYLRRLFRIVPAYAVYLCCVLLAGRLGLIHNDPSSVVHAAAFLCNLPQIDCDWFTTHTWSLAFEEQFYIAFPLLLVVAAVYMRVAIASLFACLIGFPFLRFGVTGHDGWSVIANFTPSFSFICTGCLFASQEALVKRFCNAWGAWAQAGALIVLTILLLAAAGLSPSPGTAMAYLEKALTIAALPLALGFLIVSSTYKPASHTPILTARPLLFLGTISYSLYLWQQIFTAPTALYLSDSIFSAALFMLIAAVASYYCVERPFLRLRRIVCAGGARNDGRRTAQSLSHP